MVTTHKYCMFFQMLPNHIGNGLLFINLYVFIRHFEFTILHRLSFNPGFEPVISLRFFASSSIVTIHHVYFSFYFWALCSTQNASQDFKSVGKIVK